MPKFELPVTWTVLDAIEVEANSLEEAISLVKNEDETVISSLPDNLTYVNGTLRIDDGQNGNLSVEDTIKFLKQ